jgi:hypothetical protein
MTRKIQGKQKIAGKIRGKQKMSRKIKKWEKIAQKNRGEILGDFLNG